MPNHCHVVTTSSSAPSTEPPNTNPRFENADRNFGGVDSADGDLTAAMLYRDKDAPQPVQTGLVQAQSHWSPCPKSSGQL